MALLLALIVTLLLPACQCEKTWRDAFRDLLYKDREVIYPSHVAPVVPIIVVPQMPLKVDPPPRKMAPAAVTLALAVHVAPAAVQYYQSKVPVLGSIPYPSPATFPIQSFS